MQETVIDGYAYIGYLHIPALGLELPVLSEWSDAGLKIAPARHFGAAATDDLVLYTCTTGGKKKTGGLLRKNGSSHAAGYRKDRRVID